MDHSYKNETATRADEQGLSLTAGQLAMCPVYRAGEQAALEGILALAMESGVCTIRPPEEGFHDLETNARVFFCRVVGRMEWKLGKEAAAQMSHALGFTHLYPDWNQPVQVLPEPAGSSPALRLHIRTVAAHDIEMENPLEWGHDEGEYYSVIFHPTLRPIRDDGREPSYNSDIKRENFYANWDAVAYEIGEQWSAGLPCPAPLTYLPLYAMESPKGDPIRVSWKPFGSLEHCRQVGWVYSSTRNEEALQRIVETYDAWLNGEVYYYWVEELGDDGEWHENDEKYGEGLYLELAGYRDLCDHLIKTTEFSAAAIAEAFNEAISA